MGFSCGLEAGELEAVQSHVQKLLYVSGGGGPLTEGFVVRVFRPAVGVEHVLGVVGPQLVDATELDQLLVDTEEKEQALDVSEEALTVGDLPPTSAFGLCLGGEEEDERSCFIVDRKRT